MYAFFRTGRMVYIRSTISFSEVQPFSFLHKIFLNCTYSAQSQFIVFSTGIATFLLSFSPVTASIISE